MEIIQNKHRRKYGDSNKTVYTFSLKEGGRVHRLKATSDLTMDIMKYDNYYVSLKYGAYVNRVIPVLADIDISAEWDEIDVADFQSIVTSEIPDAVSKIRVRTLATWSVATAYLFDTYWYFIVDGKAFMLQVDEK